MNLASQVNFVLATIDCGIDPKCRRCYQAGPHVRGVFSGAAL